jgi:MFS family permease
MANHRFTARDAGSLGRHLVTAGELTGRRKGFVFIASIVYAVALFVIATASNFNGFLVGMAISGLGFGVYFAVDLALVADVLPHRDDVG